MAAVHETPLLEERLTAVATEVARLCGENADLRTGAAALAREKIELERRLVGMEQLDTKRVLRIHALKEQLAALPAQLDRFHADLAAAYGELANVVRRSDALRQSITPFDEPAVPAGAPH